MISNIEKITNKKNDINNKISSIDHCLFSLDNDPYYYPFKSNSDSLQKINKIKVELKSNQTKIQEKEAWIKAIEELQKSRIPNLEDYRIVPFIKVSKSSYTKCKVVKCDEIYSFFPEIISVHSESDFEWYSRQKEYILLKNYKTDLEIYTDDIKILKESSLNNENEIAKLYFEVKEDLYNWLNDKITKLDVELVELNNCFNEIEKRILRKEDEIKEERIYIQEKEERDIKEKEQERNAVMKRDKGLYSFIWKYKRPTWDYSEKSLFLDFGEHIFQILNEETLRKIELHDFIENIKKEKYL